MASYVVMERRPLTGTRPDTVFVRDDFSYLALLFPLVWLLWHRLWFWAVLLVIVSATLAIVGEYLAPGAAVGLAGFAISIFVALEGPAWRMDRLRRGGYADIGTVVAPGLEEAEIRWFAGRGQKAPAAPPAPVPMTRTPVTPPPLSHRGDMLLGFPGEGR